MKCVLLVVIALSAIDLVQPRPTTEELIRIDDQVLTRNQWQFYFGHGAERVGQKDPRYLWANNIVPYKFNGQTKLQRNKILNAMRDMAEKVCIRFVEHTDEEYFVNFWTKGASCSSFIGRYFEGRAGRGQDIELGPDCMYMSTIQHEIIHALGFFHMQSAPNRDNHVWIVEDNIIPKYLHNFERQTFESATMLGLPYDFDSIMHYPGNAFSVHESLPTIVPKNSMNVLGANTEMSDLDIERINRMYCPDGRK